MISPLIIEEPLNQNSPEFLEFIRDNHEVILEETSWIVIKNHKYHSDKKPWYTAYWKGPNQTTSHWSENIKVLYEIFGDWEWVKEASSNQPNRRFQIHLIKK